VNPIKRDSIVRIKDNPLSWKVIKINGLIAVLESGQTGRRREELVENLRPWGSPFRG